MNSGDISASCLFPGEDEIARLVLGDRAANWPAVRNSYEKKGFPGIKELEGGRYWPACKTWLDAEHGIAPAGTASTIPGAGRVRVRDFKPDGPERSQSDRNHAAQTPPLPASGPARRIGRARA